MPVSRLLRYSGLALVLLVLAVGPFLRGLFFWTELLGAITLVAVGFGLWLLGRRLSGEPVALSGGVAGWGLLALLAIYLLQFFWAVYPRGNLDWVLRVAAAFMAYSMVRAESGPGLRRWLGWVFVLSAAALGVVGFLEYTGYLFRDPEVAKALSLVGLQSRMFTTMQYPNTAAVYFLAAMLAAMGLGLDDLRAWKLGVAGALSALLALAFFFTISRGAVVVLPFGLIWYFAGLGRDRRWPALLLLLAAAVPLVAVMGPVGVASAARETVVAFQWIGVAMGLGAVIGVLVGAFVRLRGRMQGIVVGLVLVAVVGGFAVVGPALPKQADRLLDINFRTPNVVLRLHYDQDALRMAADRPLGRGGWGWDRGYRQYQQYNYVARETHNHYAQIAVEAGWAGLAALLATVLGALWATWQSRREGALSWSLAAAAGLIAGHSAIDFNLSYGLVWLLFWMLLAAAAEPLSPSPRPERPAAAVGWGIAGLVALVAGLLGTGSWHADKALELVESDREAAVGHARQAIRFDPMASEPALVLGDLDSLARAARLDPFHSGIRFQLAVAKELQEDYAGALAEAKATLEAQPMISMYWSKVAALSGVLMQDAVYRGDRAEADRLAVELVLLGQEFEQRKAVADPLQHLWARPKLTMLSDFQLRYGQGLFLQGRIGEAELLLKEAAKVGLLGSEADVWLYVLYEKRGDTKAAKALETKPWIRFRNANPVYKALHSW